MFVTTPDCTNCGICIKECPTKAIMESQGKTAQDMETQIIVEESLCIGCGLCSTHCPEDAIQMKKVRDVTPPETGLELMEKFIAERIS